MANKTTSLLSGALLVTGTAIGAGMLALPVATCLGGFAPACVIYLACWLFMAATGLLFLEICLWMPKDANIVSMATHLLGPGGKLISWVLYLFLFYCLMIAYTAGGSNFLQGVIEYVSGVGVPRFYGLVLFVVIFGLIVHFGTLAVDRINVILMIGLIITYFSFVAIGWREIDNTRLEPYNLWQGALALPIVFTSFSYQGIIPSLTAYLHRNAKKVRAAIWLGTGLPFVIYVLWELLILGIVPLNGPEGLIQAKQMGASAVDPLRYLLASPWVSILGRGFAFFALTTSFLGVGLGLTDFLADGLKIPKKGLSRWALTLSVFVPPAIIVQGNPTIFLTALTYAGGIGCALLLGLLPVVMVWVGRYRKGYTSQKQLFGGRPLLILLALFVLFELLIEFIVDF
jgi:tyrosine-specific transport protein